MLRALIRPLKRMPKTYAFKRFIVFDVETTATEKPQFILAYAIFYNGQRKRKKKTYHFFRTRAGLTKFILSKVQNNILYVFAHNLSFDFAFLDHQILMSECELKNISINPFYICMKKDKGTLKFIDTLNFFKKSLEELFPDEKVKVDFSKEVTLKMLKKRCKKDVELTLKLVLNLYGVSASDMSFKAFRSENRVYIQKISTPLAEKSYYGGRVECYVSHQKVEGVKYYDFNSLYPSVMHNPMPVKYVQTIDNPSIELVKKFIEKGFFLFAHVHVNVPDMFIPPLPVRYKNKLIFPTGEFDTYLAQPELVLALEKGMVKKVYQIEVYYAKRIFEKFVKKYYRLKQKDKENSMFYKLVLNSLYGKFGQRERKTKIVKLATPFTGQTDYVDRQKYSAYFIYGQGFMIKEVEKRKYNTAISSAISSYGRVKLYKVLESIGFNCVYVDTDSIFTTSTLETGKGLGQLKLEDEGTFIGFRSKCYILGNKIKFKGAHVDVTQLSESSQKLIVTNRYFSTFREFIKNGEYRILERVKEFDLIDDKREGTGVTRPIKLSSLEAYVQA